jgi:hypothetical protein
VQVGAQRYVVYAHQAAAVEARLLKKAVDSLRAQSADLVGALDADVSGV